MFIEAGAPFRQSAVQFAKREAVRDAARSLTYAQLHETANRVGSGFTTLGLKEGDRVAVLSHNRVEVVELWLGLERANLVRVVMHSHFVMETHLQSLRDVGASSLVFDARFTEDVAAHRGSMGSISLFVCIGGAAPDWAISYEALLSEGRAEDLRIDVDENEPSVVQFTSGTTGQPKPWIYSHRSWRAVIANNLEHLDTFGSGVQSVGPEDVNLHFHALQWATGFQTLLPYLLRGAKTILIDDASYDPEAVTDAIIDAGVTGTLIPAPMLPPILDEIEKRQIETTAMKRMVIFFATPELLERTSRVFGPVWCHGFGSTEQGAPTTRLRAEDALALPVRLESVGRAASSFFEMAVMNEQGERLPAGSVGEIVVRSAMSTGSYWNLPEKTAQSFFAGGWFRPEDIGYIDDDGFLFYLDRAKDRISTSGGVVYPHIVESALLRHGKIANCGVVGIGHEGDEAVFAAVLLKDGTVVSPALAEEIIAGTDDGLQSHEQPSRIIFVDELPTVLGGAKVQRDVLKDSLTEAAGAAE